MKNRRTLIIFGGLFVGLLLIAALQTEGIRQQFFAEPTPTQAFDDLPRVLRDFTVLDIQAIRIGSPYAEVNFVISRTEDGAWTAPEADGELDRDTATLIARTMVLLPYSEVIPITDETDLEEFGFTDENPFALTAEVLLIDGTTHALFFGGLAPLQTGIYTVVDERDEIYLVEPRAVEFLRAQLRNPPINLTTE